jgi:integrase
MRITKASVEAAWRRRGAGVRLVLRDLDCRGLALVVNPTGMTWTYSYRPRGKDAETGRRPATQSVTLGNPATHTPDEARGAAARVKGAAKTGADPAAERKAQAQAAQRQRARTTQRLLDAYTAALPHRPKMRGTGLPSPRHVREELAQVAAALDAMDVRDTPAAEVTTQHIRRLLDGLGKHPVTARARFGALNRFLDWALDRGDLTANPCAAIARSRRPRAQPSRTHHLPASDLAKLWNAAEGLTAHGRDLARFLIAVPCRRGEAASMDWSHVDLDAACWSQPSQLTKNGDPHRLHLHGLALDLLRARHTAAGKPARGLVFSGPRSGAAFDGFAKTKARLDTLAGLTGWRWHDFRRSFATVLAEMGIAEPVADAVLNHRQSATRAGVLGVYQRSQRWPEQVEAMNAWGTALAAALAGNVVRLHAATA